MTLDLAFYQQKFIAYCKKQRKFSPHTIRVYTIDLNYFLEFLKSQDPPTTLCTEVNKQSLEKYLDHIGQKYKVRTIQRKFACIRSFFSYLEYEELIQESPFTKFRLKLRQPPQVLRALTPLELEKILTAAYNRVPRGHSEEITFTRDIAVLEMLFAGGMRVSELTSLTFNDYSPLDNSLRIFGKGGKERMIYLTDTSVCTALNRYFFYRKRIMPDCPYIFVTKFSTPLSPQCVRNIVTKYTEMAGITKNVTPHFFRHSFASLLLEEGVDIKYIQEFLGHSSISTTQIYLHTTESKKRQILMDKHPRKNMQPDQQQKNFFPQ